MNKNKTKRIELNPGEKAHIETPLGIVNISTGLSDIKGRQVDSIQIIPDKHIGEKAIMRKPNRAANVRLVKALKKVYQG